jgi:hypothetical protein
MTAAEIVVVGDDEYVEPLADWAPNVNARRRADLRLGGHLSGCGESRCPG